MPPWPPLEADLVALLRGAGMLIEAEDFLRPCPRVFRRFSQHLKFQLAEMGAVVARTM